MQIYNLLIMIKMFHLRRILFLILIACLFYGITQFLRAQWYMRTFEEDLRRWGVKEQITYVNTSDPKISPGAQACKHPTLDVHAREIMRFIQPATPIVCSDTADWVKIVGSTAVITEEAKKAHGDIECAFTDIIRETDNMNKKGITTRTHTEYELATSDYVRVSCKGDANSKWRGILSGIRRDPELIENSNWDNVKKSGLPLNVLIWGHDSLSRNMFMRKLPHAYHYMKDTLEALVLEGYNIVGDGTPQALIPILTGKTELELPETRKRMGDKASYVNIYPFVWNKYKEAGYITAYNEDCPHIGTFTYRLRGFETQPTDHYMRTFYTSASPEYGGQKKFCLGSIPRHQIVMNQVRHMYKVYADKPKFIFSFHSELSHDSFNQIGSADDHLVEFLKFMNAEGHLNHTLLIVMSDHGHRFTQIRDTQQGKQEERLPMFSFIFPPWFKKKYPEAYKNFKTNTKRLTTPFDIYPTLKAILDFPPSKGYPLGMGDVRNRSISLFTEVPRERTCEDAGIEPHWCACLAWHELKPGEDPLAQRAAEALVDSMNKETETLRSLCAPLRLSRLAWSGRFQPHTGLLQFRKNADVDGFVADLSAHTEVSQLLYQVKIRTQPGAGLFEASLRYDTRDKSFAVRVEDISRINKYGNAAHCVEHGQEQLRKFCYCKEAPPPPPPPSHTPHVA